MPLPNKRENYRHELVEGYDAFEYQDKPEDCPYTDESRKDLWLMGFQIAVKEHERAQETK